jgi:hypothetical protein
MKLPGRLKIRHQVSTGCADVIHLRVDDEERQNWLAFKADPPLPLALMGKAARLFPAFWARIHCHNSSTVKDE